MNYLKKISTVLIVFLIATCKKDITVNFPSNGEKIVFIEGMLYPDKTPQIFISTSNPFFSENVSPQEVFARGASVIISNGAAVDSLVADSAFNKFRCSWEPYYRGSIPAQFGKTYTLNVTYEGKTYVATTTINQTKPVITNIEYVEEFFDSYGGHDGVIVTVQDHAGTQDFYRFQMDRMIDTSVHHAHVLDKFINTCTAPGEVFPVKDIGRIVFNDDNVDGQKIVMPIEVTYEYEKGDSGWITMQSLDKNSADFYKQLDDQAQAILNPFVEPVFLNTKIEGALGVFGSAVLSDSILFVYPQDHP